MTKLGIRDDDTIALLGAPVGLLTELPAGVVVKHSGRGRADVVVGFFVGQAELSRRLGSLARMVFPAGGLWIAWPKKASSVATDLTDHAVRHQALPLGLVDNKVCAIDQTWTGLRLVWRQRHRSSARP